MDMMGILRVMVLSVLMADAAAPPAQGGGERIALVGARIYTSPDTAPIEQGVILIDGSWIVAVGPSAATPVPRGYRQVDLANKVITAGFWNSHVHLTMWPRLRRCAR
jgi:cytosine/adenosine deaminase-related metal-dependent hydrolase